jgi:hypothetical protein
MTLYGPWRGPLAVFYVSGISDVIRHFKHSYSPTIQSRFLSKIAVTKTIGSWQPAQIGLGAGSNASRWAMTFSECYFKVI